MYRFILFNLTLLVAPIFLYAQDADEIAKSEEYYKLGMEIFDYTHRKQATELFLQAAAHNPRNAKAHFMAGRSIMLTINKEFALPHFLMAYELDPKVDEEILYYLGQAYHHDEDFDMAMEFYNRYYFKLVRSMDFRKADKIHEVNRKMFECRNAMIYKENPVDVVITHLDENINSEWPDYAPTINADGTFMVFTSRRPDDNSNPTIADDYEYYEEIFYSKKVNGVWGPAKNIGAPINTSYHNASVNLSPDGKEMFLYSDANGGDIYFSLMDVAGNWSSPKSLEGINSPYLENSASITRDGKTLYFTSDRPGGYGGTDIYVATMGRNNRWGDIRNLGPVVNTEMDEEAVFVSANGLHLYFSSNGHAGMGDLDIYRASFDTVNNEWGKPENLGYPINSVESDIFFALTGDEDFAYMSTVRQGSIGEQDIFLIDMRNWQPLADDVFLYKVPAQLSDDPVNVRMELVVVDNEEKTPVEANVKLLSGDNDLYTFSKKGQGVYTYAFEIDAKQSRHKVIVQTEGYFTYLKDLHLLGRAQKDFEIADTIYLHKAIQITAPVQMISCVIDVYFAHDSDEPLSLAGVQGLLKLMNASASMTIEIRGYTDNSGHPDYNKDLSFRRAQQVRNYLLKSGIDESRIAATGLGQEQPIADNKTMEGRRMNRRVEYVVITD